MSAEYNYVIKITVDPTAAKSGGAEVEGALRGVEDSASRVQRLFTRLIEIEIFHRLGDALEAVTDRYTELANRVRSVTDNQLVFNGVMDQTYAIAQRTRLSWDTVAEQYQRVRMATKDLGMSQQDALNFTENLSLAVQGSGVSARSAEMGMADLTRGLQRGNLNSRELREVMGQLPVVADLIAKHFHTVPSELYEMSRQGKLTARELVAAINGAHDELEDRFNKMVPTIHGGWTVLTNAAEKFFGEMMTGSGVSRDIANLLIYLGQNFQTVAKYALIAAEAIGVYFAEKALVAAIQGIKALTVAMAENPFTAALVAITAIIAALYAFRDTSIQVEGVQVKLGDAITVAWRDIKEIISGVLDVLHDVYDVIADGLGFDQLDGDAKVTFEDIVMGAAKALDTVVNVFQLGIDTIWDSFKLFGKLVRDVFEDIADAVLSTIEASVNGIISAYNYAHDKLFKNEYTRRRDDIDFLYGPKDGSDPNSPEAVQDKITRDTQRAQLEAERASGQVSDGVKPIDLGRYNPSKAGDVRASLDEMNSDRKSDMGGSRFQDMAQGFLDDVKVEGSVNAVKDLVKQYEQLGMSAEQAWRMAQKGHDQGDVATAQQIKAMQQLQKQWDNIVGSINPTYHAQEEINKAFDVGSKMVDAHRISVMELNTVIGQLRSKYEDALDPVGAVERTLRESNAVLEQHVADQKTDADTLKILNDLRKKNVDVTAEQTNEINNLVATKTRLTQVDNAEKAILSDLHGAYEGYVVNIEALNSLLKQGAIDSLEYQNEFAKMTDAYLAAGRAAQAAAKEQHGFATGLDSIKKDIQDFGRLTEQALVGAFKKAEDALVQFVVTGKFNFQSLVDSMLADMTRLVLRKALFDLFSLFAGPGGAATQSIGTSLSQMWGMGGGVPGFAGGGDFNVGGVGGTDSQLVMFRATPGESVSVKPGSHVHSTLGPKGGNVAFAPPVIRNTVVFDARSMASIPRTPGGRREIINAFAADPAGFNRALGR